MIGGRLVLHVTCEACKVTYTTPHTEGFPEMLKNWNDVKPGDTLTARKPGNKRSFKIRVVAVNLVGASGDYATVTGYRLRADGKASTIPAGARKALPKGQRREFLALDDVSAIEPAAPAPTSLPCMYLGERGGAPTGRHSHLLADSTECHPAFVNAATEYSEEGHWLTEAGKAKVAELRGEAPADTRIADPVEAYGFAVAEYVVRGGNPDDVMPAAPEIRAGDLIEIRQPGKRKWAMRTHSYGANGWMGTQIRMTDGKPGQTRVVRDLKPGEYTIVERAKPAAKTVAAETRPARVTAPIKTHQSDEAAWLEHRDTVTDDDNVPVLSKAQIDALHWIGAPEKIRARREKPNGPTLKVLRRLELVEDLVLALTTDGRAAYLAHEPTGRLSKPFGDAWRAATVKPAVYAHDAHCNTQHVAGPERCPEPEPPAIGKGPVKVIVSVEAHPCENTFEIDRAEWEAMTPGQRSKYLADMAIDEVANAGGCGWHIEDEEDAAMVGTDPRPELPTLDKLMAKIERYVLKTVQASPNRKLVRDDIRYALEVLYREAGR